MILAVASGKGGTGKSFVSLHCAFASEGPVCLLDCDVEAPNTSLFLDPKNPLVEDVAIPFVRIDPDRCTGCGECVRGCAYSALARVGDTAIVFPGLCHGCGGCLEVCPEGAIVEIDRKIGEMSSSREVSTRSGVDGRGPSPEALASWAEGRLALGEALGPPLIRRVRKSGVNLAGEREGSTVIIDCPPGTSCPMVAAVRGADYCILVTEDTPFGLNDLELSVEVLKDLSIPCGIVINKFFDGSAGIEVFAERVSVPVLLEIPYDEEIASSYSRGLLIPERSPLWKKFGFLLGRIHSAAAEGRSG
jgi:MinD superfamily P-loop ATPase